MAEIQIGSNAGMQNVDWSSKLTGLANSVGCEGVKVDGTYADGQLTLKMTQTATGRVSVGTYQPELDPAELTDPDKLEVAKAKFGEALAELDEAFGKELPDAYVDIGNAVDSGLITEESTGYSKALFNVYALIRLIQECSQEQKAVARDIREADLQASITATKAEADAQRAAAQKGLALTIGLSLAMAGLSIGTGGFGASKQFKAIKARRSGGSMKRATSKYELILAGGKTSRTGANRTAAANRLTQEQKTDVDLHLNNRAAEKVNAPKTKEDVGRMEEQQAKLEANTDEALKDLNAAKRGGDKKEIAAKEAQYEKCLNEELYGRSVLTDEKCRLGMDDSLKADLQKANVDVENAARENNNSLEIANMEKVAGYFAVGGNSLMMFGNAMGGVGSSVQQEEMAKATEIETESKEHDARREEANEVFSAAQELINNVLDLYRQVIQSESQSTDRIIQA